MKKFIHISKDLQIMILKNKACYRSLVIHKNRQKLPKDILVYYKSLEVQTPELKKESALSLFKQKFNFNI